MTTITKTDKELIAEWRKRVRKHGIAVTTAVKSCSLGCAGCVADGDTAPAAIWQTAPRSFVWDCFGNSQIDSVYLNWQDTDGIGVVDIAKRVAQELGLVLNGGETSAMSLRFDFEIGE